MPVDLIEGGIADYPDDFNWKYFQTAPRDQRIASIRGVGYSYTALDETT